MSTSGISTFLYGKADVQYAYRRLMNLQKLKLVHIKTSDCGGKFLWTLTKKGYHLIKPGLPSLCSDGYKSESASHDFLSSFIHIGPYIYNPPSEVQNFSEQELRRVDPKEYPDWVPLDTSHRSDGYWRVPTKGAPCIISLEVELSCQGSQHYREVARYYERNKNIARTLWVVKSQKRAEYIRKCMQSEVQENVKLHNFVLYSDFLEKGCECQLRLGAEDSKPMSIFFKAIKYENPSNSTLARIVDLSKNPTKTNRYKTFDLEDFHL